MLQKESKIKTESIKAVKKRNLKMLKKLTFILGIIIFISCNSNNLKNVFAEYKNIGNGWEKNEKVEFLFQAPDSINTYNIFLNLRNNESYPFSNLFLIVNMSL